MAIPSFSIPYAATLVENHLGLIIFRTKLSGGVLSFQERTELKEQTVIQYRLTEYHSDEFLCSLVFSSMCRA